MKKVLHHLWLNWKRVALVIGRFQTRVLISLLYFVVIAPTGSLMRLFGWDPLEVSFRHSARGTNWKPVAIPEPDEDTLGRQS